jgi:hypothetical protein
METNNPSYPSILSRHFKMTDDYILDLVVDLFEEEKKLEVTSYYDTVQEGELNAKMRTKLIEWMIQLADEVNLGYKTKQVAITLVDLLLSQLKIHKKYLQLLGITCIFITVKSEESFIYTLTHACEHCANAYTREEVSAMEMLILKTLKWKLQYPTPGEIARRLVHIVNGELDLNLAKIFKKIDNFIDLSISDYDLSIFSPSAIAVAAIQCSLENSALHIITFRKLMMENFPLDFENKIDPLYANIVQKLNKFFPGYFQFPTVEEWTEIINYNPALQNGENQHPQEQIQQMQQVQQMGGPSQLASVGNGGGMEEESY